MSASSEHVQILHPSGDAMPRVGLGTWKAPKGVVRQAVQDAIRIGYRAIDCASDYGNEVEVGEGIRAAIDAGICKREDLFVTSKLWNTFHAKEHVEPACRRTLSDLGLDYVDLYLIHFPIALKYIPFETRYPPEWTVDPNVENPVMEFADITIRETWEAMEAVHALGLAKNIGVSNFNVALLMDLLKYAKVHPSVLQIEFHPLLQQPTLRKFCASKKIAVTGYSNFGGLSYIPLGMAHAKSAPELLKDERLIEIGKRQGKSSAQVILGFCVSENVIVIPKSTNADRLKQNMEIFDLSFTEDDLAYLCSLDQKLRFNNPAIYADYP
eukprot:CAMPEP_0174237186 /NCGR_PEP_ID=MMETSP0417-20130205/7133_1 /TAXON_ID=242541 /ORGANISM="Mayorella sp, Strain BSH-02190019" /LENGTH=324 /DNA_ID=CAMNT_0015315913 /DNA_START=37 /DNA_END=1007 /DNA_ORIENTATION=+